MLVLLAVMAGTALRLQGLGERPFWVDEAESTINALTILEHGYPADHYLGIPIFENLHVWRWPENPEYEFRDVSYSDKGFAVYHGWLPLYSMAVSLALHGIQPDQAGPGRTTKHNLEEQKRLTRAARMPSVVFAAAFLVIAFLAGRIFYCREAGWAALAMGSIYPFHLSVTEQARYYSAQVTFSTLCCLMLWLLLQKCEWRHVWLTGAAYVLLFHTHLLSFATAAVMAAAVLPFIIRRHKDWLKKMTAFGAIVAAGTLPWIILTGFYGHQSRIPRAWPLLQIPADLLRYPPIRWPAATIGLCLLLLVFYASRSRDRRFPQTSIRETRFRHSLAFLSGWSVAGYAMFLLFMPAASFARGRIQLGYWGPLFILGIGMTFTASHLIAARAGRRVPAVIASSVLLLWFCAAMGRSGKVDRMHSEDVWACYQDIFRHLNGMGLDAKAKLFAAPNRHLVLSVYSGLPVQDITPIRKEYLDSYAGDIVYINADISLWTEALDADHVRAAAVERGHPLSDDAAETIALRLRTREYREVILTWLAPAGHSAQLEPISGFEESLLAAHRATTARGTEFGDELLTQNFSVRDWSDWGIVFKYRFVGVEARRGRNANFAERLRGAEAVILSHKSPIVIFRSKWHPPNSLASIEFRFEERKTSIDAQAPAPTR